MLNRASRSLEGYETRLGLLARTDAIREKIDTAVSLLESGTKPAQEQAERILKEIEL